MTDTLVVAHTAIAIIGVVLLILAARVEPVIALVIGSIYLGLAAGLGFEKTISTIAQGFGDIMTEVGLLIGFGVLLGSLLFRMGALQKLVELLLRLLGPRRLPYALASVLSTIFPSIYVDVQLVLAAPLARSAAPGLGRNGVGMMGGALSTGILVGYVFVIPGLGTVSIAGLLGVPLGTMLLYGFGVGLATAVLTVFLYGLLLKVGFWNPDKDEAAPVAVGAHESAGAAQPVGAASGGSGGVSDGGDDGTAKVAETAPRTPPLYVSLLPILVPLVMIAAGAIAEAAGVTSPVIAFFGDPVLALFVGLVGAYLLSRGVLGNERTNDALGEGLNTTGQILLVTGVGGSLGAVIGETALEGVLGGLFSADAGTPALVAVLLAWLVAAVLHVAIGSISVAAIAAAGILAPIMGSLDLPPAVLGLSIGAGALFALHVNSNFFWMFQSLLGVTTRGTLKALTFVTSLASVVSLVIVVGISLVV
ncbi:GntP family permease [Nocardiopsis dassonvillei]|uniref:Gluconate transporter n=1 Tax=Nocardiopsis dassonvillei (strain ATCC 23218 / DSM 43111 / CIP 107115 / JCM 7437 / KCTC 9190 / NBRC 14626 / NCTC 10488 / NRRL B-5397 / IMRU 509) TaxID=446468 RepID=D7B212_NOCDD|nr:gluconate transporter [Nocardiopsis dassonvillei]ADH66633.1 Gluconate transporter [Nocardiopsis dassonvillei subsp. dassonvillei DSM 43111]NKY78946.1 GntP family permease [Nocardiopsis dassonvillei]VEI92655.1 5-keto-D-gluconate transporter [Nocardiopsis dassonvillei]